MKKTSILSITAILFAFIAYSFVGVISLNAANETAKTTKEVKAKTEVKSCCSDKAKANAKGCCSDKAKAKCTDPKCIEKGCASDKSKCSDKCTDKVKKDAKCCGHTNDKATVNKTKVKKNEVK